MKTIARIATAFAAGAALMYFLDPQGGRRRRALVRDRSVAAGHDAQRFLRHESHRITSRAKGALARARTALSSAPVGDDLLREHVRARIGHLMAYPGQVNIDVVDGHVLLRGHASIVEIERLDEALPALRGVASVDNRLIPSTGV